MLQVKVRAPLRPAAGPAAAGRAVFVSYAHADRPDVEGLVQHLQPLAERERLDLFFDADRLRAGDVWSEKLQAALACCELFLLLVTPASLASQFCIERELLIALDRQRRGLCRVVPVVLRACDWKNKLLPDGSGECLGRFQVLPAGGTPVATQAGAARDEVWLAVVESLAEVLATPIAAVGAPAAAAATAPALLPYLCDQVDAERNVRELLTSWRGQAWPLVVLLRADAPDCPDWFINRIDERHLRKLLPRLTPLPGLLRHSGLQWPTPQLGGPDAAALESWFLEQLVERVTGDPYASEDDLLHRLRDEATNRLFIAGLPTAPADFLQRSLQALGACLGRIGRRVAPVRLAAVLWSEDPALKLPAPASAWACSGPDASIGVPAPLGRFDRGAVRHWALLDEVQRFAAFDLARLDAAFEGAPAELTMREFAAIAAPLLQQQRQAG